MILHPQKLFDKAKSSIPKSITMLRDHDKHDLKVFLRSRSILIILVDAATLSYHQLLPKSHESQGPSSPESFMDIHRIYLIRSWTRWVWRPYGGCELRGNGIVQIVQIGPSPMCPSCHSCNSKENHSNESYYMIFYDHTDQYWNDNNPMNIFSPETAALGAARTRTIKDIEVEPTGVCIHSLPSWKDDEAYRMCGFNCTRHLHLLLECVHYIYIYHIQYHILLYIIYYISYIINYKLYIVHYIYCIY